MNKKQDMWKIRRMLGENYHLCEECGFDNGFKTTWKLYAKYAGWIDDGSEPIMTSETHTYEDLYKFAKEHCVWDCDLVVGKASMVVLIIILVIAILNCFWNNKILMGFIWGINVFSIILSTTRFIVSNHNWKITQLKYKERWGRFIEDKTQIGFREDFDWNTRLNLKTEVNGYEVSTVDLGIDHSFGMGNPLYYETMVLEKDGESIDYTDLYCERYSTEEEARKGHKTVVKKVKKGEI